MTEWERGMRDAIRHLQWLARSIIFDVAERFTINQSIILLIDKIAEKRTSMANLKSGWTVTVTNPEELRQEFLNNLAHRLEREQQLFDTAKLNRDKAKSEARITLLADLSRFWTDITIKIEANQDVAIIDPESIQVDTRPQ